MHTILDPSHATTVSLFQAFTPASSSPMRAIERPRVHNAIRWAMQTPGHQLVIYGQSGSGKSTAVARALALDDAAESVVIRCTTETTLSSLLEAALAHFGMAPHLDAAIAVPRLAAELGMRGTRVIVEDAHRLAPAERLRLAGAMKIFSDLGDRYPALMIIAIAAMDTGSLLEGVETEFSSRISEVRMPLFSIGELVSVVETGGALLNVDVSRVAHEIALRSGGLPGIAHALSLATLGVAGILETQATEKSVELSSLRTAIAYRLEQMPPHLVARLDQAFESGRYRPTAERILSVLGQFDPEGARIEDVIALASDDRQTMGAEFVPDIVAYLARPGSALQLLAHDRIRFVSGQLHSYWSLISQPLPAE